jgi:tripartite-type tricarboxylate transporter receptor subunit TctC
MALEPLAGSTPDSFAEFIKSEIARWKDIVRNTGAQPK